MDETWNIKNYKYHSHTLCTLDVKEMGRGKHVFINAYMKDPPVCDLKTAISVK